MGKVDFPEAPVVPVAIVHVVLQGKPAILQQLIDQTVPIIERQQHSLCVAGRAANGEVFCDFRVADGFPAIIDINKSDLMRLKPPQVVEYSRGTATGCANIVEDEKGSSLIT